jgi:hypothetical protein
MVIDRIVPDAEGGVALVLFGTEVLQGGSHRLLAIVVCDDDGEAVVTVEDRVREVSEMWLIEDFDDDSLDDSLDRIALHLTGKSL